MEGASVGAVLLDGYQLYDCSIYLFYFLICFQLDDDEEQKGKKDYIDFKRVVWHESFRKLLETVCEHSITGFWVKCGDGITRHLFPMIFISSADYEEQYVI